MVRGDGKEALPVATNGGVPIYRTRAPWPDLGRRSGDFPSQNSQGSLYAVRSYSWNTSNLARAQIQFVHPLGTLTLKHIVL